MSATMRLDRLLANMGYGSRRDIQQMVRHGCVVLDGAEVANAEMRLPVGPDLVTRMQVNGAALDPPPGMALMLHKPLGVTCSHKEAGGLVYDLLPSRWRARDPALSTVGRLDKETSGLLLVAKTRPALVKLQNDLRSRAPERAIGKTYAALVIGGWPESLKVIDVALRKDTAADGSRHVRAVGADDERGRRSISLVRVTRRFAQFSLLDVTLKTGRTHQIRVHLADAGHAIAGDPKYGDFALNRALARGQYAPPLRFERMFLHARRLRFVHPASGEPIELEAPLPEACEALLEALASAA
jgi:23S rRNA pseudouridine955/2504/2580 synthase